MKPTQGTKAEEPIGSGTILIEDDTTVEKKAVTFTEDMTMDSAAEETKTVLIEESGTTGMPEPGGGKPESRDRTDDGEWIRGQSHKNTAVKPERKRPGRGRRMGMTAAAIFFGIVAAAAGAYIYLGQQYRTVFFPNTMINGIAASGKTAEQVKEMIQSGMKGYILTLELRGGGSGQIAGEDINLHAEYDGTLERLLAAQEPLKWGIHYKEGTTDTISTMVAFDKERLEEKLRTLECMDVTKTREPENAYLSDYITGTGYLVVPENPGNRLIDSRVLEGVQDAIMNLQPTLSLEELDAYEKAEITSDSPELNAKAEAWNRYTGVTVTYQFGDATERLDGDIIHAWLSENEYGNIILDEEQLAAYVRELAEKYNTAYKEKRLKTSYGPTVTISKGNYGWRINQTAEVAALSEIIRSGTGQTREPIYSQMAASHGSQDYGDTYVEINLTAQHLFFYKNGSLLVESDFVSGSESRGWSTPSGAYPLTYKQRNATLKGEGYATPVSYWMPFNGGIGMHDANWRSSFGGAIYKTGGSHGCINLPPEKARLIYENISSGMPVLCYQLEGTQKGSSATAHKAATAAPGTPAAPPETPAPSEAIPSETPEAPSESQAAPSEGSPVQTNPAEVPTDPSETPASPAEPSVTPGVGHTESYGPGGAPVKPDTGAVAGPGM